jgi:hypothetical protein
MDIALVIDRLVPGAAYTGSATAGTEAAYNSINWTDEETKPLWSAVVAEWAVYEAEQAALREYKIYDLLASNSPFINVVRTSLPVDIDFKTGLSVDLYKEVIMSGGAPVYKKYYTNASIDGAGVVTYSNPIVKIDYTFVRDSISLAKSCMQKIYWYDTDGGLSAQYKPVENFFTYAESIEEAELRRSNIINDLKVKTIGLLMITESITQVAASDIGKIFLAAYKPEIINYIDEANPGFVVAVAAASIVTYPWLENMTPYSITIRQFILNGLA